MLLSDPHGLYLMEYERAKTLAFSQKFQKTLLSKSVFLQKQVSQANHLATLHLFYFFNLFQSNNRSS